MPAAVRQTAAAAAAHRQPSQAAQGGQRQLLPPSPSASATRSHPSRRLPPVSPAPTRRPVLGPQRLLLGLPMGQPLRLGLRQVRAQAPQQQVRAQALLREQPRVPLPTRRALKRGRGRGQQGDHDHAQRPCCHPSEVPALSAPSRHRCAVRARAPVQRLQAPQVQRRQPAPQVQRQVVQQWVHAAPRRWAPGPAPAWAWGHHYRAWA